MAYRDAAITKGSSQRISIDQIDRVERVDSEDRNGEVCSVRIVTRSGERRDLRLQWRNPDRVDEVVVRMSAALKSWRDADRALPAAQP